MVWKVLFADDEPDIVETAKLTLSSLRYRDRPVEILWAYSESVARDIIEQQRDIAVAFVDVMMETPKSGLDLLETIRATDHAWATRVILLTGQPSLAPEVSTTVRYDLDGYLEKASLTSERLFATTYSALRAYDLITRLDRSRHSILNAVETLSSLDAQDALATKLHAVIHELIDTGHAMGTKAAWAWQSTKLESIVPGGSTE